MRVHPFKLALFVTLAQLAASIGTPGALAEEPATQMPPVRLAMNHPDGIFREGDMLQIGIESDIDAHVYVFYHDADGNSVLLFPNVDARDNRVAAETRSVPLKDRVEITAPFGVELLQVLAADREIAEFERWVDEANEGVPTLPSEEFGRWRVQIDPDSSIPSDEVEIKTEPRRG